MPGHENGTSLWDDWVEAFLTEQRDAKGMRPATVQLHEINLRLMRGVLDAVGAPADPRALVRRHIVAAVARIRESGRQPQIINSRLQSLKQLFTFAVAEGWCQVNPAASAPGSACRTRPRGPCMMTSWSGSWRRQGLTPLPACATE